MASAERIRLIVGLGNPGAEYASTRHNVGFMVVDNIAEAHCIAVSGKKFNAVFGRGSIDGRETLLVKPMAYMNRSGPPVQQIAHYYRFSTKEMLVIHDDMDLEFGRLKIKEKGGHGGHKGVRSIMDAFGSGDFTRLRIGVGRPAPETSVTGHVLSRFAPQESKEFELVLQRAAEAVMTVCREGAVAGMNRFNQSVIHL